MRTVSSLSWMLKSKATTNSYINYIFALHRKMSCIALVLSCLGRCRMKKLQTHVCTLKLESNRIVLCWRHTSSLETHWWIRKQISYKQLTRRGLAKWNGAPLCGSRLRPQSSWMGNVWLMLFALRPGKTLSLSCFWETGFLDTAMLLSEVYIYWRHSSTLTLTWWHIN